LSHLSLANKTLGSILYRKKSEELELTKVIAHQNAMRRNSIEIEPHTEAYSPSILILLHQPSPQGQHPALPVQH